MMSRYLALFCVLVTSLAYVAPAIAVEIKGKIVDLQGNIARVSTDSELVPNPGDVVEIYFEIPGLEEPVFVASGKVQGVDGDVIRVTVTETTGRIERNQLARISSAAPQRRAAPTSTTSVPTGRPGSGQLAGPNDVTRRALQGIARLLPEQHLSKRLLDDDVSRRWFSNFFQMLDSDKLFFLQSDVDRFSGRSHELDDLCRQGDASLAYDILNVVRQRIDEVIPTIPDLVRQQHDFTANEELIKAPEQYATTAAERQDRWRRQVKHHLLVKRIQGVSDDEARVQVIRKLTIWCQHQKQLDDDDLLSTYLTSLAGSYDPLSSYLSPRRIEEFQIGIRHQLQGIGAALQSHAGEVVVTYIVRGGPAARDGRLQRDDKIVGVGQGETGAITDVTGWKLNDVVQQIRGKAGAIVRLQVIPKGRTDSVVYNLARGTIQSDEARGTIVERGQKADGSPYKIGYIQLLNLYSTTYQGGTGERRSSSADIQQLIENPQHGFKANRVDLVVLDLSDNSGGPLSEALAVPGLFLDPGAVLQVKGTDGVVKYHPDDSPGMVWDGPLVVVTNRYTAGGGEIVAAAIQDYGRGLVIGNSTTMGLGTVQQVLDIGQTMATDGNAPKLGALKVTYEIFYRVNGQSTQLRGVAADVVLPSIEDGMRLGHRYEPLALPPDTADPYPIRKLKMVMAKDKPELQNRSDKRRANAQEYRELATTIEQLKTVVERKSRLLTEDAVREEQRLLALTDPPTPTTAIFNPTFENEELLAVALDYLQLVQAERRTTKGR